MATTEISGRTGRKSGSTHSTLLLRVLRIHIIKPHLFFLEHKFDTPRWSISVFADVDIGHAGTIGVFFVIIFAVHHENHIGILLDAAGIAQVAQARNIPRPAFHGATELGESDNGYTKF